MIRRWPERSGTLDRLIAGFSGSVPDRLPFHQFRPGRCGGHKRDVRARDDFEETARSRGASRHACERSDAAGYASAGGARSRGQRAARTKEMRDREDVWHFSTSPRNGGGMCSQPVDVHGLAMDPGPPQAPRLSAGGRARATRGPGGSRRAARSRSSRLDRLTYSIRHQGRSRFYRAVVAADDYSPSVREPGCEYRGLPDPPRWLARDLYSCSNG